MEEFELVVAEEYKFENGAKKSNFLKFQTARTLIQASQIDNSPIKNFFTTRIFSMPTLIAKIKPVVLVKYELEYREKLKVKCFGPSGY